MCVCAQGSYFEGDYVRVFISPVITILYHNPGNFLTSPRSYNSLGAGLDILGEAKI